MNIVAKAFAKYSNGARAVRAALFRASFTLDENTRILDLGSETGSNIHRVLAGTTVRPGNVFIADIDREMIELGKARYGYTPVLIAEDGRLPFPDGYFDIVYCSSVIEHVTVSKSEAWSIRSGSEFRSRSIRRQREFADEIRRLGRQYFVQTPYRYFPVESHTWLPFIAYLPRWAMLPALRLSNAIWIKKSQPDWNLLDRGQLRELFGDTQVRVEKSLGLIKSIIAIKTDAAPDPAS